MNTMTLQLMTAFFGSLGFCLLFRVPGRLILTGSVGGMLGWLVFLVVSDFSNDVIVTSFAAATFCAVYSGRAAKHLKAPATLFLTPTLIPLVPGGSLYYCMSYAVRGEMVKAGQYGTTTIQYVLGIAGGVSLVAAVSELYRKYRAMELREKNEETKA